MKTRQEIKELAKTAFLNNYWIAVGVNVVVMLLVSAVSGMTMGIGALILMPPLLIGLNMFSLKLYRGQKGDFDTVFNDGFSNFGHKLGGYLWMELFTFLWSLLFVIPGIIKSYSYAMTPYILVDQPEVDAREALKRSMRMMDGHKWELFVFQLSFIGWALLSSLTCGILYIFYVGPYYNNAMAGYYEERKNAFVEQPTAPVAEEAAQPTAL